MSKQEESGHQHNGDNLVRENDDLVIEYLEILHQYCNIGQLRHNLLKYKL